MYNHHLPSIACKMTATYYLLPSPAIRFEFLKADVNAGMPLFNDRSNKIRKVGYDIIRITWTFEQAIIDTRRIERVLF